MASRTGLERIVCVRGDITREAVDAVANAANEALAGGGGVDGAIHRAAGPGLLEELRRRYPEGCPTGEARVTSGHDLPARFVIHCVGPRWHGGDAGEARALAGCYRSALELAEAVEAETVAFPAISTGIFGYPLRAAAEVALGTLADELARRGSIRAVRLVLFDEEGLRVHEEVRAELAGAAP